MRSILKNYIVQYWLVRRKRPHDQSMILTQVQQAWARIVFGIAGTCYLYIHAPLFDRFIDYFLPLSALYFLYNLAIIPRIRHQPLSAFRTLFGPAFDILVVGFGMFIDGGHSSGIYFMLLIIIFGNAFRYGNALLLYSQFLSTIGLILVSIATLGILQQGIDLTLLFWQLIGLIVIPLYIYLVGEKAEKAFLGQREAEETSLRLLDQGPLPVFTFDLDEQQEPRVLYANETINQILHDEFTSLIGEKPDVLCLPEDSEEMNRFCKQTLLSLRRQPNVLYIRGRSPDDDNPLRLMCTATYIHWHNRNIGVCFIHDVTERESLRQEYEHTHRQGYMSTLVAGIVHDFRNVLTSIIGHAEVMQMEIADKHIREQLETIIEAGERGSAMVTHLLTLGKSASNVSDTMIGDDHRQILERIIGIARLQLPAHIKLKYAIDTHLPTVAINLVEIEQLLLNLINNAAQSIVHNGQINVAIKREFDAQQQEELLIQVQDNGSGIAEEDLDKVTKPFWTSREKEGGTGLGLAMVQRIVRIHNGTLHIASKPGQGTTVSIRLPSRIRPSSGGKAAVSRAPAIMQTGKSCHILLVDDAPDVLNIHAALLRKIGHRITTAQNGKEALQKVEDAADAFDMIITDYRMPEMDGLELIIELRHHQINIPIMMVTAYGEDERLQQVHRHHVTILRKPINLRDLNEHIIQALQPDQSTPSHENPHTQHP